ncbi:MAG: hypothetical protein LBT25_09400 [Candidatus Symbiothrix sp.]|jgi:hypothetical protein|nr:hypothetical protein [Candidatus Symbiothrix sp.]
MKIKNVIIICIIACLLGLDIYLLHINYQNRAIITTLNKAFERTDHLRSVEYLYKVSKEITKIRLQYERYPITNHEIYAGSDTTKIMSIESLVDKPKLIFGSSQNMCLPCIYSVLDQLAEIMPDYSNNENIIFIADIENRLKNNYHNKKVISFIRKEDFPLYEIGAPYLFILDKDMLVKMLFITDKTNPELTKEYLKMVKKRFPNF